IRAIAANGAVTCELDDDTNSGGTITAVTAGAGLTGGGANGAVTLAVNPAGVAGTFVILTAPHTAIVNNPGASVGAYSATLSPYGLADAAAVLVRLRCWFNEAANLNDVCYVGSGAYGTIRNGSLNFDDRQFVVPVSGGWLAWGVGGASAAVMVVVDVLGYWR
ncbi:MAG: hypothetical protein KA764_18525, partial [Anaerolineales bacterium]|nr:hypothetical protein [Anaerolineales bacterium]